MRLYTSLNGSVHRSMHRRTPAYTSDSGLAYRYTVLILGTFAHDCIYIHVHVHTHARIHMHMHIHMQAIFLEIYMCVCMYVRMYAPM